MTDGVVVASWIDIPRLDVPRSRLDEGHEPWQHAGEGPAGTDRNGRVGSAVKEEDRHMELVSPLHLVEAGEVDPDSMRHDLVGDPGDESRHVGTAGAERDRLIPAQHGCVK